MFRFYCSLILLDWLNDDMATVMGLADVLKPQAGPWQEACSRLAPPQLAAQQLRLVSPGQTDCNILAATSTLAKLGWSRLHVVEPSRERASDQQAAGA